MLFPGISLTAVGARKVCAKNCSHSSALETAETSLEASGATEILPRSTPDAGKSKFARTGSHMMENISRDNSSRMDRLLNTSVRFARMDLPIIRSGVESLNLRGLQYC